MSEDDMSDLTAFMGDVLSQCHDRGMQLPWLLAVVAINGSMMGFRFSPQKDGDGLEPEVLTEHTVGGMMQLPINIMIVDATGEAARVVIDQSGITFH